LSGLCPLTMKFLCLHGIGTNNQIFKMQTAAFRYELADQHTYEFVQGVIPWRLPEELASYSNSSDEHYAYYGMSDTSFIAALDDLEAYIEAEGPYDGVMAYSQGAGLATMLLVRRQHLHPDKAPPFRCAILFSPVQVYDPVAYLDNGAVAVLDGNTRLMGKLQIPVSIIFGETDERKNEAKSVESICGPSLLSALVHKGGHEVPGAGSKNDLLEAVKAARRAITRAELAMTN
jgi:predicted esterase